MATPRFLVAESETPEQRERRRASVGRSSGETYLDTLRALAPDAACDLVRPAEEGAEAPDQAALAAYDAVFLTGSPLHVYQDTPGVRRQLAFMRDVFASGTPSFGSCAGLQVAAAAAGGAVRENRRGHEAAFARRIVPTRAGRDHPLLAGRPAAWDAPAIHTDEVERLPEGAVLLAGNGVSAVQAAEIRHGGGVFWGVQYHPELTLGEIAAALAAPGRRPGRPGARPRRARRRRARRPHRGAAPGSVPPRPGLAARPRPAGHRPAPPPTELRNFIERLVRPAMEARGRTR
jgi:GMP synthase (glutamine-hydrolysing)